VLRAYLEAGRLPHALLLHGPAGSGKSQLARTLAKRLLCTAEAGEFACGQCSACRLQEAGTHPDFVIVEPDEPGKALKVDVVRDVVASLALRPLYAHNRVVLLPGVDLMNRYASNSLLKTLEEPDLQTRFLLLAENPGAVPATIRSRCQLIPVKLPTRELTAQWLRGQSPPVADVEARVIVARGAPLRALSVDASRVAARCGILESFSALATGSADPVDAAGRWEKFGPEEAVSCLISWLEDLIRLRAAPGARATNNPDFAEALRALTGRMALAQLYTCLDLAYRAKRQVTGQLNRLLLLEELAIACSGMAHDQAFRGESDRDER
jgi:DNA polymerase-3 subunit delta'